MWNKITLGLLIGSTAALSYIFYNITDGVNFVGMQTDRLLEHYDSRADGVARALESEIFKEYASKRIDTLRSGLSKESNEVLDFALNAMLYQRYFVYNDLAMFNLKMPAYQYNYMNQWENEKKTLTSRYHIYNDQFPPEVFFFHHGLRFADKRILDYIRGKDIIDCGAFVGDSLVILKNYTDKNVYCYEFDERHIKEFPNTIKNNNIVNYKLVPAAVGDTIEKIKVWTVTGNLGQRALSPQESGQEVNVTTLDVEAVKEKFNAGFIKMDVEGYGFKAIKGAIETIKRDRPVLSLAVYHNTDEFFEIKPYLESNLENYVYEFKLQSFAEHDFGELTLFAYPKEIITAAENVKVTEP